MSNSMAKAREWAQTWPVGSMGLFFISRRQGRSPVTVVDHVHAHRTVRLALRTPDGYTYYCTYGSRRDLQPIKLEDS